jgi:uncharacterized protein YgiM (DUF1202 family)
LITLGLLSLLILVLSCPAAQAYSGVYYVIPTSTPLRECAAPECATLLTAYQGDKVEILERNSEGWSRVRLVDRTGIGWIPNNLISYSPDLQARTEPPYYVNVSSLLLHDAPTPNSRVLTTLHLNEPVEMLGVGTSGWAQIRELRGSTVGWVPPRFLSRAPAGQFKAPRRHRPAPKAPPKEEKAPKEAPAAPKAM